MIELVNIPEQTIAENTNVLFSSTAVKTGCAERHREGSGIITLLKPGVYRVTFNADIAIPTGGAVEEILVGLTLDGEPLAGSTATVTPAAVEEYFNVSTTSLLRVYGNCCGGGSCCVTTAVRNLSTQPILVRNANVVVTREC